MAGQAAVVGRPATSMLSLIAKGTPYSGKKLFTANCGKCHTLFGQGGQIGPDLTSFKRDDVANMLVNIVNPSAEVREGSAVTRFDNSSPDRVAVEARDDSAQAKIFHASFLIDASGRGNAVCPSVGFVR